MRNSRSIWLLVFVILTLTAFAFAQNQWYYVTPLPKETQMNASVYYNGYLYCIGGYNMVDYASTKDVYYIKIGPQGRPQGSWQSTTSLPDNMCYIEDAAFAYNGRMYVVSGWDYEDSVYVPNVYYADINPDGSLGSWNTAPLPSGYGTDCLAAVQANGYIYVISGENAPSGSDVISDKIHYAKINTDGSLGTWSEATLPKPLWFMEAEAVGNYLIVFAGLDGWSNTTVQTAVYSAPLNPSDGSIGTWTTQANSLPVGFYGSASCVYGNTIYTAGGRFSGAVESDRVYWAEVDTATGTVGVWQTGSLPDPLPTTVYYNNLSASDDGYLYIVGGRQTYSPYVVLDSVLAFIPPSTSAKNWSMLQ